MPKAVFLVQSQPSHPERDTEYNDWYDAQHVPDVCAVPGVVSARRFTLVDDGERVIPPGTPPYLALYEIDAEDPSAPIRELVERVTKGEVVVSDALCRDPGPVTLLYVERT